MFKINFLILTLISIVILFIFQACIVPVEKYYTDIRIKNNTNDTLLFMGGNLIHPDISGYMRYERVKFLLNKNNVSLPKTIIYFQEKFNSKNYCENNETESLKLVYTTIKHYRKYANKRDSLIITADSVIKKCSAVENDDWIIEINPH